MGARKHSSSSGNKSNLLVVTGLFICIFILLWKDTTLHTHEVAPRQHQTKPKPPQQQTRPKPLPFHKVSYLDDKPIGRADIAGASLLVSHVQQQQQQQGGGGSLKGRAAGSSAAAAAAAVPASADKKVLVQYALDYSKVFKEVYGPAGYHVCPASADGSTHLCWLQLRKDINCRRLFEEYRTVLEAHVPAFPAPRTIPPAQRDAFLLRNYTQLSPMYLPHISRMPTSSSSSSSSSSSGAVVWTPATIAPFLEKAKARVPLGYNKASLPVYQALDCHPVKGLKGAVFGADTPWLEGVLFAAGSSTITTIEQQLIASHIPNHQALQPLGWVAGLQSGQLAAVDYAFAFGSWETAGLGRFGDALDPWGDVKAVQRASCYVRPGGLLYLAGPSSATDQIMFNAHRVYGPVRLPLLTANWEVLGVYDARYRSSECGKGTCQGLFARWEQIAPVRTFEFQPVVVLRNLRTTPCDLRAEPGSDRVFGV